MSLLEPNFYGAWIGKQSAQGSPNTTPSQRLVKTGGQVVDRRSDGKEQYSDLTKYGNYTDWVDSIIGEGELGIEATPTELAYLLWLFHGGESVTAVTGPPAASRHQFTPALGQGYWFTLFERVGNQVARRLQHNDCLMTKWTLEASVANKAVKFTPRILSLDPAVPYATDPSASLPTTRPFLHTDLSANGGASADGSLTLGGTTYRTVSNVRVEVDDAWEPVYGDSDRPVDFVQGDPGASVAATLLFDSAALAKFNMLHYGTASPAAGTKPIRQIPATDSFSATYRQRDNTGAWNGLQLDISIPAVKWTLPDAPAPNSGGGMTELALVGEMRRPSSGAAYTIGVNCASGVAAFTV